MRLHRFVTPGALSAALLGLACACANAPDPGRSADSFATPVAAPTEAVGGTTSSPTTSAPRASTAMSEVSDHRPHAKVHPVRG